MGFAVIPIIFTIAEDSLANVPQHLRAGSLAHGRDPMADRDPYRAAHREPRHLLRDHDRLRARGRRDDDRAHGHREHPGDGRQHLQWLPGALREHRGGAAGGAGRGHAVPGAVPRGVPPLLPDLRREHRSPSWSASSSGSGTGTYEEDAAQRRAVHLAHRGGARIRPPHGVRPDRHHRDQRHRVLLAGTGHSRHPHGRQGADRADGGARAGARERPVSRQAPRGESRPLRSRLRVGRRGEDHAPRHARRRRGDRADRMGASHRQRQGGARRRRSRGLGRRCGGGARATDARCRATAP